MGQEKIGTFMKITLATKELVGETSNSVTTAVNLIDVSSKATCRASAFEYGRVIETGSVSSIASSDGSETAEGWSEIQAAIVAGTKIAVEITQYDCTSGLPVVGAVSIAGTALISNLTWDMPDNEKQTFSADYTFDGATTVSINA